MAKELTQTEVKRVNKKTSTIIGQKRWLTRRVDFSSFLSFCFELPIRPLQTQITSPKRFLTRFWWTQQSSHTRLEFLLYMVLLWWPSLWHEHICQEATLGTWIFRASWPQLSKEWALDLDALPVYTITGNGKNIRTAVCQKEWTSLQCMGRTFQMAIKDAKETHAVSSLCKKGRAILGYSKHSA